METHYSYRDYRPLAHVLQKMNIPLHIYGNNNNFHQDYSYLGSCVYPTMPYVLLMQQLSRYDWGYCGAGVDSLETEVGGVKSDIFGVWDRVMPNKLFEYVAMGTPVIAGRGKEMGEWIKEYEVGIVIDKFDEIKKEYGWQEKYRKNCLKARGQFTMEKQVLMIERLYEKVSVRSTIIKNVRDAHRVPEKGTRKV